jgi:hypothetical protein
MEEKKRPAEDPLEGESEKKRQRVEEEEEEKEEAKKVLLDPNTWSPHIVGEDSPPLPNSLSAMESLLERFKGCFNSPLSPKSLGLYGCVQIRSLPPIIFECRLFKRVNLNLNWPLKSLPVEIGQWKGAHISLCRAGITHLPPEMGDCQELRVLELDFSAIQELPRRLGKCPSLVSVYLDVDATADPERPRLSQFAGLFGTDVAMKLKLDWANYVTSLRCFVFCLESRICKETADGISGDIPRDIVARIASFV